ncbi:MAG: hypothetical protein ACI33P_08915 [Lysinibacillus sp.]
MHSINPFLYPFIQAERWSAAIGLDAARLPAQPRRRKGCNGLHPYSQSVKNPTGQFMMEITKPHAAHTPGTLSIARPTTLKYGRFIQLILNPA